VDIEPRECRVEMFQITLAVLSDRDDLRKKHAPSLCGKSACNEVH